VSITLIVLIVVVVLVLLALLAMMPRLRERNRVRQSEAELGRRREQAVEEHRSEAELREARAAQAERQARMAEQVAQRERADAQLQKEQAAMHEQGMADDQLVAEHERADFAGTSAVPEADPGTGAETGVGRERTSAYEEGRRAADDPARAEDFEAGQRREQG
jgi:uncharacterized protein HemX